MASMALAEERDAMDSSSKGLSMDVAMQSQEEGTGEHPVKARKPYTITKQREKWTEEEHEKFLEALKLYGRSWRQIQEHIGTKTAVQIRSHAQKFFSKVVREPGAKIEIEIPPPRPKRKPLHPYPRKRANSGNGANPANGQPKVAHMSSSSGSDQENGSPVSVLSVMQSDAFGSSTSNPSTRCNSPESSDEENNVPPMANGEEGQQTGTDKSTKEADQDNKDTVTSEEDSSDEVQVTSVKLFGKMVVIPDPRTRCSSDTGSGHEIEEQTSQASNKGSSQSLVLGEIPTHITGEQISQTSNKGTSQAPLSVEIPTYTPPPASGWVLPYNSFPLHFGESAEARIARLHMWWPYYGFPIGYPRGPIAVAHNEATDESEAAKSPLVESSSDSDDNSQSAASKEWKVLESLGTAQIPQPATNFQLKPSTNSAFVRVKKPSTGGGDQPARGFVPYKRCKVE